MPFKLLASPTECEICRFSTTQRNSHEILPHYCTTFTSNICKLWLPFQFHVAFISLHQCDQIAGLFVKYLTIYNIKNCHLHTKFTKVSSKFCHTVSNGQNFAKLFQNGQNFQPSSQRGQI